MAARVTLRYSRKDLQKAFKKIGVSNTDFEDKDNFEEYVNALLIFLEEDGGVELHETEATISPGNNSMLRISLVARVDKPGLFPECVRTFQEFMLSVSGK